MPHTRALTDCLRQLDALLRRPISAASLHETARAEAMADAIAAMNRFHELTRMTPESADGRDLIAVGCRLCADLADRLRDGLIDAHLDEDAAIEQLATALRQKMQTRAARARLLGHLNLLRQQTCEQAEAAGLGVIIG